MNQKPVTIKSIFALALHKKSSLINGQILTILAIIVSVPIPLMLPVMVDEVLLHKPEYIVPTIDKFLGSGSAFYYIALVAFAVIFLRFLYYFLGVISTKIFTQISKYVTFMIRSRLLKHLQKTSMNAYETLGSGAITANLITDINTLDAFIMSSASRFVASVLTLLAVGIVMIVINPVLGILILFVQPLIMFVSKKMSARVGELKKEENQAIAEFQENVGETLDLFGQIKASNKEQHFFGKAIEQAKKIQDTSNEFSFKSVAYEKLSYTIFLSVFELIRASGLLLVAYSDLSIGMMFAMFGYIWFIMTPVQDILSMQYSYASAKAALERINKVLTLKTETSGEKKLTTKSVDISLKNICFSYASSDKFILKEITFDVKYGSKTALIGASGSGKTTLAQIIAGFYEKTSGELRYNNIPTEELDKHSVRQKIFLVLQMPILFNASLRFNITMGHEDVTDEAIYKALEIAQLQDMLQSMPSGLDTLVGHHGIRLSGGQRQRLSIARMIIANPSVVIFDESTSALDVHTEAKLFRALAPLLEKKTVITIAHRLSTVKNADMIYVLNEGEIVQRGTHEELEEQEGHYSEFLKEQLL
ncbi:ABC transporter ATP-binding protein [Sulfurimonas sp. ST-27]|uniref:ABC transporter ATP-binding protein n=1 Tax=Sulfurimonas sp. ST-27 TaxID=3400152 RepID=UPI003AB4211D